jgi:antitoxin (DNA-binding transcriptional repressor) of toxin-antitoxin stability system
MKAVGIREFKAKLSQYLRDVQAGEVVLVTDRGKVVAEVRTPGAPAREESDVDRALRRLAEKGGLLIGEPHDPGLYVASPLRAPEGTAARLIDEERGER